MITDPHGKSELRPGDPFTAQDGARLFYLVDQMTKRIDATLQELSNRMAVEQRTNIQMIEILTIIEAGLSETRHSRLEIELREAEIERDLAERQLRIIEDKVKLKQEVKEQNKDTAERIKDAAQIAAADIDRRKRETSEAFWIDLKRSIIKAVVISIAVGGTGSVLAFIFWLVQLYLNRGT